jgi:chorismate mutase
MLNSSESKIVNIEKEFLSKPMIKIFGPCSAESESQVLSIAKYIKENYPDAIYRAGVWKPRTRPNSFEGVGEKALEWLKKVKSEYQLKTAVEVANAQHVEAALNAGIDILWIGARTTVSPFSVQEIANALRGVEIPIYVKNPVSPDLDLWMGAIERIQAVGIKEVSAIHRGFHSSEKSIYRNIPKWEIPIELKSRMPEIKLICDPSHISGNRELISYVAQKAIDLDMDGLMIETHIDADNALSDAKQQLYPNQLIEVIGNLIFRNSSSTNEEFNSNLNKLRTIIDDVDEQIVKILGERLKLVEQIGFFKKENNVTILQIERWKEILKNAIVSGKENNISEEFISKIYQLIHDESIKIQTEIMNKK